VTAVEVRAPVERLTLAARLKRLARHVQAVVDDRGLVAGFAAAVLAQLEPAVADAEVQALDVEMLRAQAADRERARDGLQSARRDLQNMADLIDGLDRPNLLIVRQWAAALGVDLTLDQLTDDSPAVAYRRGWDDCAEAARSATTWSGR
jgi:hypothetical protein